jgi:hypothetical protein
MNKRFPVCFVLVMLLTSVVYSQERKLTLEETKSERRVALVIGNSSYAVSPLKNPVNDAHDIAKALTQLRFDVIYRENLNQNDMKRAIREFGARIRNGSVGLFYFAGHGVQVNGINYLVPVDAKIESAEEVEYECVDAGFVLAQMESAGNNMNIVILDACRNDPFVHSFRSASRGLAQMDAPSGTLIAYATAPGSVASDGNARNGLYTQELLKFMQAPGLGIENVFKQVRISVRKLTNGKQTPWESSSLTGDFFFNSVGATNLPVIQTVGATPDQPTLAVHRDGVYVRTFTYRSVGGAELIAKSYVKFEEDGTVRVLTLRGKLSDEIPTLNKLNSYGQNGSYTIKGSHLSIVLAQEAGSIEGSIEKNGLAVVLRNVGSRFKSVEGEFTFNQLELK